MKTMQVADYVMDKFKDHGGSLKDFTALNYGEPVANNSFVYYDPTIQLGNYDPEDPELHAHQRIRKWLTDIGYTDDMGEILIYVWW